VKLHHFYSPAPESRLLPAERLHGPTVTVVGIMTFAMIVVAAGGLALANAAATVASGVEHRYVIQLPPESAAELPRAVDAARAVAGVADVSAIPEAEMRETLERWLGDAASSGDLPVPVLATVELSPQADPARLSQAVRAAVPEATVTGERAELEPLLGSIRALQWLAIALVGMMAAATAAAIVLAARGALDTHRSTVEIMHRIGATDRQVTRLFERKIAFDAIAGSLGGATGAAIALALIGAGISAASAGVASVAPIGGIDFVLLALIPVVAVALVIAVAHWALLRALRETL